MATPRGDPDRPAGGSRGWRFVLLAQPTVQAIRFLSKLWLASFLLPAELGQPMMALLVVQFASMLALLGLDEGLVYSPQLTHAMWRRLRAVHHASGAAVSVLCALAGWLLAARMDNPELGRMLMAFAPMVWLANTSVLPTALLVRERAFQRVFLVDVYAALSMASVTIALAAAGAGPWSLVGGWYANAIVTVLASTAFARPLLPAGQADQGEVAPVLRYGAHLSGAGLLAYLAERLDSILVGSVLGFAVLGVYELARHVSQWSENFFQLIAERGLFPILAARHREHRAHDGYQESLRAGFVFALPLNVLLSFLAVPIITHLYRPDWAPAGPLLAWLALAAGARCVELAPLTALKATGRSRTVLTLGAIKLALLAVMLPLCLPHGARVVAMGVVVVRTVGMLAALVAVASGAEARGEMSAGLPGAGLAAALVWCAAFVPGSLWLTARLGAGDARLLAALPLLALLLWAVARVAVDQAALRREWGFVRARWSGGGSR